jgi:creatinine amidohydrolase/Fe(II)-dependent formamide hydrolase-like protein
LPVRWDVEEKDRDISIDYMPWPAIAERMRAGFETIVFSVGATEKHGPHLPENIDELLGTEVALELARRLGNALVAPTIRPGLSPQHMEFPGTISLRPETLRFLIEDYVHSLASHGFRRFVVISAHFGNRSTVEVTCQSLQEEYEDRAIIVPIYSLTQYVPAGEERFHGFVEGFHANNFETSLVLHLAPHLVDMNLAEPGGSYPTAVDPFIARMQQPVKAFSPSGVLGHPERGNAVLGQAAFDAMISNLVKEVEVISAFLRNARRRQVQDKLRSQPST